MNKLYFSSWKVLLWQVIAFPNLSQREAVAGAGGSGKVRGPSRLPAGAQAMFYIVLLWVDEPALPKTVAFVLRPRRQRLPPLCVCSVLQHTAASPSASAPLSDARTLVLTLRGGWCPPWAPYLRACPFPLLSPRRNQTHRTGII